MADGDYERDFQRKAELERIGRILRSSKVSDSGRGSNASAGLRSVRDVVEEMARRDRGLRTVASAAGGKRLERSASCRVCGASR